LDVAHPTTRVVEARAALLERDGDPAGEWCAEIDPSVLALVLYKSKCLGVPVDALRKVGHQDRHVIDADNVAARPRDRHGIGIETIQGGRVHGLDPPRSLRNSAARTL